jgi:SAM-dependent methyltransferase
VQSEAELRQHFEIEQKLAARLREAPSKSERRRLYGEVYRQRSELIPSHPLVQQAADPGTRAGVVDPQVNLLRPFVDEKTRFCEVGAGDGAVARALAPLVETAVALDVTDALALPDEPSGGFEFRIFDGFDLGLPPGSIDLVYSNDVVEHLHPDDMLDHTRGVLAVLRRGGIFVCVTPNRLSGPHDVSRHFAESPEGFHLREYSTTELAAALRESGFSQVKVFLTVGGRRLSPLFPAAVVRPLEALIGMLPRRLRRRVARGLAAVKVAAVK